jgi:hypothetical protein
MSERDPSTKIAVNINFNDNNSDNGLTVVNMSATTSIYSQCSENRRNPVHLYAPELTHAFDTTHTSTTDRTRTKPMTEISIKNFHDEDTEFRTTNSPPTSNNNRPPQQPNIRPNHPSPAQPRQNNNYDCRPPTHQACPFQQQNCGARPPFRPISSNNTNQRRPQNNNNATRQNPSTLNAANNVCNNFGRLGHYANQCITASH